jgi:hypothetical protein
VERSKRYKAGLKIGRETGSKMWCKLRKQYTKGREGRLRIASGRHDLRLVMSGGRWAMTSGQWAP